MRIPPPASRAARRSHTPLVRKVEHEGNILTSASRSPRHPPHQHGLSSVYWSRVRAGSSLRDETISELNLQRRSSWREAASGGVVKRSCGVSFDVRINHQYVELLTQESGRVLLHHPVREGVSVDPGPGPRGDLMCAADRDRTPETPAAPPVSRCSFPRAGVFLPEDPGYTTSFLCGVLLGNCDAFKCHSEIQHFCTRYISLMPSGFIDSYSLLYLFSLFCGQLQIVYLFI